MHKSCLSLSPSRRGMNQPAIAPVIVNNAGTLSLVHFNALVLRTCVQHSKNETRSSSHHMTIRVPTSQSTVTGTNKGPNLQASKTMVTSYQTRNYHESVGHNVNIHHWGETSLARFPRFPPDKALDCKYTPSYAGFSNSILYVLIQLTELVVTINGLFWRHVIRISAGPPLRRQFLGITKWMLGH